MRSPLSRAGTCPHPPCGHPASPACRCPHGRCQDGSIDQYQRYARDSTVLSAIGRALHGQSTAGPVRIPRDLALAAAAAWSRDELDELADPENDAQTQTRHHAASLALIGLTIEERSDIGHDPVLVDLDADLISAAIAAAWAAAHSQAQTGPDDLARDLEES